MSTSPNPSFSHIPGGFAAARLNVVADERVQEAQEQARGLGYTAGYAAGARAAAAETEALRAQLAQQAQSQQQQVAASQQRVEEAFAAASHAAQTRVLPLLDDSRALLYSLALDLASVALGVEIQRQSQELPGVTVGAVAALQRALEVPHDVVVTRIRMNPADAALVQENWAGVCEALELRGVVPGFASSSASGGSSNNASSNASSPENIEIVPDPSLNIGDAVSEFEDGFLDARLQTAMNRARVALDAELEAMELKRRTSSSSFDAASASILASSV